MITSVRRAMPARGSTICLLVIVGLSLASAGCANLANVRALGSGMQKVTTDTATIVASDEGACTQSNIELAEYNQIFKQSATLIDCDRRTAVLDKVLLENKAFQAYGAALANLAQDQYVTTDDDGKAVSASMTSLGVSTLIVTAAQSVFTSVETWALKGYRQRNIKDAITGEPAKSFLIITGDLTALAKNYRDQLDIEVDRLDAITAGMNNANIRSLQPIAAAEMTLRLKGLRDSVVGKEEAVDAYNASITALPKALAAAQRDVEHTDNSAIAADIKTFVDQAKDAHDKVAKAF